ncbi:hypothetical protein C8J57DRAFT_1057814 [Mycena rebaudengoi]|nr:hypothetical protein C8J57DRAFT_1075955 [Mycena rebaudengoi]KAJ7280547.1 hypothetical protein C8J57DRAFT_1057814 [Mycena rebaudengoi]
MTKLDKLKARNIYPPFKHSVFTTVEWSFGDSASPPTTCHSHLYYTWCAVTAIGNYAAPNGNVILWKDELSLPFIPGTTVLFPAGCHSHSFAAVDHRESRYYFKQYFNAGLACWADKDLMSDSQFKQYASPEEFVHMEERREARGEIAGGLYSKLNEIFVL